MIVLGPPMGHCGYSRCYHCHCMGVTTEASVLCIGGGCEDWGEILLTLANINYYVLVTGFCWSGVGGTRASAVAVVSRRRWRTLFTVGVGCLVGSTRLYSEQNVIEKSNGRITLSLDWASHTRFASTFPKKETFTAPTSWLGTHWCWRWHLTDRQSLDRRQFIADRRPLCVHPRQNIGHNIPS